MTAGERAGKDGRGAPARVDAVRGDLRLPKAFRGQYESDAPAEALGRDAFDVAVANQNELGLVRPPFRWWHVRVTLAPPYSRGVPQMPADPNRVILTGENPFIR